MFIYQLFILGLVRHDMILPPLTHPALPLLGQVVLQDIHGQGEDYCGVLLC